MLRNVFAPAAFVRARPARASGQAPRDPARAAAPVDARATAGAPRDTPASRAVPQADGHP